MSIFTTVLKVHQSIYESTNGLLGHKLLGVPTLLLRTTGRKSGVVRTSALIYIDQKGSKVIVASKGGDPNPPAWLLNLEANDLVEYQIERVRVKARAEVLDKNHPDYASLWQAHNASNANRYDEYQEKTDRPIPLVRLVPVEA